MKVNTAFLNKFPKVFQQRKTELISSSAPVLTGGAGGSRLVATCGGDSVCVIDCETGMVMKKYKVHGEVSSTLCYTLDLTLYGKKNTRHQ